MKYLYLALDIGSISIPLLYTFIEKKFNFSKHFINAMISIVIVAIPFLIWDAIFTTIGVWGFNEKYFMSFTFFGMPFEEWLFFICIPYACLFLHESLRYYIPNYKMSSKSAKAIAYMTIILAVIIIALNFGKKYTTCNLFFYVILVLYAIKYRLNDIKAYFPSFLIIIIPFVIVNGILTGSGIEEQVVWYNNDENMGYRFYTIPYEDFFYAFNMLFPVQLIFNTLTKKA